MNQFNIRRTFLTPLSWTFCVALFTLPCGCANLQQAGQGVVSAVAGAAAYGIAKHGGASDGQALALGMGAATATYITLKVIDKRNADEADRRYALQKAMNSKSKSDTVYVAKKKSGGQTELIRVNKSKKTVSPQVQTVASNSITQKDIQLDSQYGEVIY